VVAQQRHDASNAKLCNLLNCELEAVAVVKYAKSKGTLVGAFMLNVL
jgi:hypothetical protein